jgi:site-specific recombinase XerD
MESELSTSPEAIRIEDFTQSNVNGFLRWIESSRGCGANTCNNRLAAIKSFFRYAQSECPEWIDAARPIFALNAKKTPQAEIAYLSIDAIRLLLEEALYAGGIRDAALLSLLYDTGARVQEAADLLVGDLRLEKPCTARLTGKGRKTRIVPLTMQAAELLRNFRTSRKEASEEDRFFLNWKGDPIGRAGIAHILQKHTTTVNEVYPGIMPPKVTPHMLRHSKAMHLLENGVNLIYIRDLLGHETVVTTEVYAKANPEMKRKAIEASSAKIIDASHYDNETKASLLAWLREIV